MTVHITFKQIQILFRYPKVQVGVPCDFHKHLRPLLKIPVWRYLHPQVSEHSLTMFWTLASSFQGYCSVKQGKSQAAVLAYTSQTATELTIFTFHNGNFIQIVSGAAGTQITSQVHPLAEKMRFLSLYLFPPPNLVPLGRKCGCTSQKRPQSTPAGSPPEALGHSVDSRPQSGEHLAAFLSHKMTVRHSQGFIPR